MNKMNKRFGFAVLVSGAMSVGAVGQTWVHFDDLASDDIPFGQPDPASVLTDDLRDLGVLFGRDGVSTGVSVTRRTDVAPSSPPNSIVGLDENGLIPQPVLSGDIYFSFVAPGTNTPAMFTDVSFTIGDAGGDLDIFQIRSYDVNGNLLDSRDVQDNARFLVDLSNVGALHRVEVDFAGGPGYSLDDLRFTVPGPGSVLVMGLGLAAGVRRRR